MLWFTVLKVYICHGCGGPLNEPIIACIFSDSHWFVKKRGHSQSLNV